MSRSRSKTWHLFAVAAAAIFLLLAGSACDFRESDEAGHESVTAAETTPREEQPPAPPAAAKNGDHAGERTPLDAYKARLSADREIRMPGTGRLKVWIGAPGSMPADTAGMISDTAVVPAVGESARVFPYAPDFKLDRRESGCIAIHPAGSEEIFTLKPVRAGRFVVGATVRIYPGRECSGAPVPRVVPEMAVTVTVNMAEPLLQQFWEKLRNWIVEITGIFFVVLTLLLRKKIGKWLGIEMK